jgi:hypothetical protein
MLIATTGAGVLAGIAVVWIAVSVVGALYPWSKGYPFLPMFIAALFLGFPIVVFVVAIAVGRDAAKE